MPSSARAEDPIYRSQRYTLWPDRVEQGPYLARALSSTALVTNYRGASGTPCLRNISPTAALPKVDSDFPLLDALYNLACEELARSVRHDGAFSAGAQWPDVWTRDVSYSILLSLAIVSPDAAMSSLLLRVEGGTIVQDSGTGGSWPVSTDRMIWALAAWEVYTVTGSRDWLRYAYGVVKSSIRKDERVAFNSRSGLFYGETSFLDWREQTYPRWMQPADIFQSEALSTNAIHYQTYRTLEKMEAELNLSPAEWNTSANHLRESINRHFWISERGIYGQYRYGRSFPVLSGRVDALGCSLTCLFGVADEFQRKQTIRTLPRQDFGTPVVYPQSAGVPAYHNDSVWPFVETFCMLAAARERDESAVLAGVASLSRAAAFFQTNKENFVLGSGDSDGTVLNSDRQLWSVAGMLAVTYRILFGMRFEPDGLYLEPFVPHELGGVRRLTGFRYRRSTLNVEVHGHGHEIRSCKVNGYRTVPFVPQDLQGEHTIVIHLDCKESSVSESRLMLAKVALETPEPSLEREVLRWPAVEGATAYCVYQNGLLLTTVCQTEFALTVQGSAAVVFQVAAVSSRDSSYLSVPIYAGSERIVCRLSPSEIPEVDPESSFSFVTTPDVGKGLILFSGSVSETALYELTCVYANGSGPINTGKLCAVLSLSVDGEYAGRLVMPQRGQDAWNLWGESSAIQVELSPGSHEFEVRCELSSRIADGGVAKVRLAQISLRKLSDGGAPQLIGEH